MKNFVPPKAEIIAFEIKDVITTSEIKLPEDEIDTLDNL